MEDLYSEKEPEYRATRVKSGIPPPSSRDQRRMPPRQGGDLSRFNPAIQRAQPQRYGPYDTHGRQHQRPDENRYNRQDGRYPEQQRHDGRYPDQRYPDGRHYDHRQADGRQQPQEHRQADGRQQEHRPIEQRRPVVAPKPKPLDLRTSTDFLKCEHRLSVDEIMQTMAISDATADLDFLSSKGLVEKVNTLREKIRHVPNEQRSQARSRSNPFERISNGIFMNRAATKLAALDATFGLTVTQNNKEFTFADICGGPGGFSEYLLWRVHSWGGSAHGFGVTLKSSTHDEVNWHTEKFRQDIPRHSLTELEGDGDLYKDETIRQFEALIVKETKGQGVDLAVADGGFDFSGNEEQQEVLAQRLLLREIISMLTSLKRGGHFVCKFFDIVDEFTGDLVWLLYQLFEEICITKPLSSRPANSERYIVCKGLLVRDPRLVDKLLEISKSMEEAVGKRFIPKQVLEKDEDFVDYVKMRNMKFVMKQTEALEQLDQFIKNPDLAPLYDQEQIKKHCLSEWRIPL
ncbi:hypothetical protein INT47_006780 [Mucor saturninus]|uniref:Cap-specific mRNA (nucleoside-2'-O-)-methyltransferase 1 n=1 Tax=Mucor saturninus TaxID=64648 RepID=A0A8H7V0T7_9FUNG|nr:hypothetical protein INT47_006780 [Mucor saturninus]